MARRYRISPGALACPRPLSAWGVEALVPAWGAKLLCPRELRLVGWLPPDGVCLVLGWSGTGDLHLVLDGERGACMAHASELALA